MRKIEGDDAEYLAWLGRHPDGFVVNTSRNPKASYLILHRASCGTIGGKPTVRSNWTTGQYIKVCSENRADLNQWARQNVGGSLKPCGLCRPD